MTRDLRRWMSLIEAMPEAEGVDLDVTAGAKHWHVTGRFRGIARRICVVSRGKGNGADPSAGHNYRLGARKALLALKQVAGQVMNGDAGEVHASP